MFSPPLKKSIVFLKYALKMDLVKGAWFDLYRFPEGYGGVDMTPAYFGEPVDWSRAYQREKEDYEDRDIDAERE